MNAFTADSKDLLAALSLALTAIDSAERIPVLSCVLLEAEGATLKLTTASTSHSLTTAIDALCDDPLAAVIPAQQLISLVRLCDALLTFKQDDDRWVIITADGSRHRLPSFPRIDFPLPERVVTGGATINGPLLASMLAAAAIAAETNPFGEQRWRALEFDAKDGRLSITGCCGPRLSNAETPFDGAFYALVPEGSVRLIGALAGRSEAVSLSMDGHLLTAASDRGIVSTQLASAPWPEWRGLVQGSYPHAIEFDSTTMVSGLRRALLASEDAFRVTMALTSDQAVLTCNGQRGESREQVVIAGNGSLTCAMAGNQMVEYLKLCKGGVVWEIADGAPHRFTPKEPLAFSCQYLQMPLRD